MPFTAFTPIIPGTTTITHARHLQGQIQCRQCRIAAKECQHHLHSCHADVIVCTNSYHAKHRVSTHKQPVTLKRDTHHSGSIPSVSYCCQGLPPLPSRLPHQCHCLRKQPYHTALSTHHRNKQTGGKALHSLPKFNSVTVVLLPRAAANSFTPSSPMSFPAPTAITHGAVNPPHTQWHTNCRSSTALTPQIQCRQCRVAAKGFRQGLCFLHTNLIPCANAIAGSAESLANHTETETYTRNRSNPMPSAWDRCSSPG